MDTAVWEGDEAKREISPIASGTITITTSASNALNRGGITCLICDLLKF